MLLLFLFSYIMEINGVRWFVLLCLTYGLQSGLAFTVSDEISLKNLLLSASNGISTIRPSRVTLIELSFNIISINTVDIKNEQFGLSGWWSLKWRDSRLNWVSSSYTGFPVVQVYSSDIWTPALVVDNSIDDLSAINEDTIPLRIRQDGQVTWNPPGILKTSCEMDVTHFPFDTQTCSIQVTSFGYTIEELNISVQDTGVSLAHFQLNGEWNLLRTWNERSEFSEDGYTYAKVTLYFLMDRRGVYYGLNTMLPVLLNSLLIPLVFLLPHDAGEKIGYCLTCLLAYVVILTIVTDGLPTTAKTQSLLGVYIAVELLMAGLSVVLAIHSLHIYHRCPDQPIPGWQARLTSTSLRLMRCCQSAGGPGKPHHSVSPTQDHVSTNEKRERPVVKTSVEAFRPLKNVQDSNSSSAEEPKMMSDAAPGTVSWQLVARAYDAFFLRVYFAIISCTSLGFFWAIASNQL